MYSPYNRAADSLIKLAVAVRAAGRIFEKSGSAASEAGKGVWSALRKLIQDRPWASVGTVGGTGLSLGGLGGYLLGRPSEEEINKLVEQALAEHLRRMPPPPPARGRFF